MVKKTALFWTMVLCVVTMMLFSQTTAASANVQIQMNFEPPAFALYDSGDHQFNYNTPYGTITFNGLIVNQLTQTSPLEMGYFWSNTGQQNNIVMYFPFDVSSIAFDWQAPAGVTMQGTAYDNNGSGEGTVSAIGSGIWEHATPGSFSEPVRRIAFQSSGADPTQNRMAIDNLVINVPTPQITGTQNFRINASPNTVGFLVGDTLRFGANNVIPAGLETTMTATQDNVTYYDVPWTGGSSGIGDEVAPNQYRKWIPFDRTLSGFWTLKVTNGTQTVMKNSQTLGTNVPLIPFVTDIRISGTGTTPAISWIVPTGVSLDDAFICIYDDEAPAVPRKTLIYQSPGFAPTQTTFHVPQGILVPNHRYVIRVRIEQNYNRQFSGPTRTGSDSFLTFIPRGPNDPPEIYLPTDDGCRFLFNLGVTGGSSYSVQAPAATGYRYTIGAGDPNFAFVTLPQVGDGLFSIYGPDGTLLGQANAGAPFAFGTGGASSFTVRGVEIGADAASFISQLTFSGDGRFTGAIALAHVPVAGPTGAGTYQFNTPVALGGSVSGCFTGDIVNYRWMEGSNTLFSGSITTSCGGVPVGLPYYTISNLAPGTHIITLQVSDGKDQASQNITVTVLDTEAPILAPAPDKTILWPANHN